MFSHLWTAGPIPEEYVEFILCERFGWTLDYVRNAPAADILSILTMMDVEAKVKNKQNRK